MNAYMSKFHNIYIYMHAHIHIYVKAVYIYLYENVSTSARTTRIEKG